MSNQKKLTVSILGRSFSLLTDENSEIIEAAAEMVEAYIKGMGGNIAAPADLAKKTTFVALRVAVELIKKDKELQFINNKTNALNDILQGTTIQE